MKKHTYRIPTWLNLDSDKKRELVRDIELIRKGFRETKSDTSSKLNFKYTLNQGVINAKTKMICI